MTTGALGVEVQAVVAEYMACARETAVGKPRRFMERFLMVQDEMARLVPMVLRPNQVYYYGKTFGSLREYGQPMDVYCLKPRKALWTTFIKGALTSFLFQMPGFHAIMVADSDDTFRATNQMIDRFYDNMPEVIQTGALKKKHWETEFKEIDWGGITSSLTMSSSRSPNFARGFTPKAGDFDEVGFYNPAFESRVYTSTANSFPVNRWLFKGGTPNGMGNQFYRDFQAIKGGEWNAIYLFRRWYDNPQDALPEGHPLVRPYDRAGIVPGNAGGLVGERDEPDLIARLDPDRWRDQLRFRRRYIADAKRLYGDEALAYAAFKVEHAEDDLSCWSNLSNPQFDPIMLGYMANRTRPPIEENIVSGLNRRLWEKPMPGHVYVAGMDVATGQGGDATTVQVFDATAKCFVAELWGKHTGILMCIREAMELCRTFNTALFAPEINTVGAQVVDETRLMFEYPNIYRRSLRRGENPDTDSYRRREWGWKATEESVRTLWACWQQWFNGGGAAGIPNEYLSREISSYDPSRDEHWPDRMRAAAIAVQIATELRMMGGTIEEISRGGSRSNIQVLTPSRALSSSYFRSA